MAMTNTLFGIKMRDRVTVRSLKQWKKAGRDAARALRQMGCPKGCLMVEDERVDDPVVKLDITAGYGPAVWGFESLRGRQ